MTDRCCPEPDLLQRLLQGEVSGEEAETLEEHMLSCDACAENAGRLSRTDELSRSVRTAQQFAGDEQLLADVIERGKQLRSDVETVQSVETVLIGDRTPDDAPPEPSKKFDPQDIDFLHSPVQDDEIGRLGGYRILEVLGVGGMGVVFRAEDPRLRRQVALKAMKPAVAASKSAKERFLNEAQAAAAIEHDHIVTIHQVGEDRGIPFIAMRYLQGESLQSRLDREHRVDQREVVRLGRQIALGLAAAHERGLIHRDIKPDNVWLDSKQGRVKILDFGLVRSTSQDAGLTQSGMVVGTPKYMAPEQAEGQTVDHRCDLFSLGSVLYHLASGQAPFEGPNLTSTLLAVARANPTPITTLCPQLHPELAALIMLLLSKGPTARPQTATEVAELLEEIDHQFDALAHTETRIAPQVSSSKEPEETAAFVPQIVTDDSGRPPRRRKSAAAGWWLFGTALLAGIIFLVTSQGTVTIDIAEDLANEVRVDIRDGGETVAVLSEDNDWSVRLIGGQYQLEMSGGGDEFSLKGNTLTVSRFGRSIVQMEHIPSTPPRAAAGLPSSAQAATTPLANYALSFDGENDYVETPVRFDVTQPLTVEAYVTVPKQPEWNQVVLCDANLGGFGLGPRENGKWRMDVQALGGQGSKRDEVGYVRVEANDEIEYGRRTHVAAVYDGRIVRLYVDGKVQTRGRAVEDLVPSTLPILIGANPNEDVGTAENFLGTIDEVRISSTACYTKDFTPAERLDVDEHTLALYHFDDAEGTMLTDASGNGHHGTIHGATWVRVDDELNVIDDEPLATPADPYARDRAVAQWVVSQGGTVGAGYLDGNRWVGFTNASSIEEAGEAPIVLTAAGLASLDISDDDLERFAGLPALEAIGIGLTDVTVNGLHHLVKCPRLLRIQVNKARIQASELTVLKEAPSVFHLHLDIEQVDDQWVFLKELPRLRQLSINGRETPNLEQLQHYLQLRLVAFPRISQLDPSLIETLQAANPQLRILVGSGDSIQVLGTDPLLDSARRLIDLGVSFRGTVLADNSNFDLDDSESLGNSRVFSISEASIPVGTILTLEQRKQLASITHYWHSFDAPETRDADAFVEQLGNQSLINSLVLVDSDLTDAGLDSLAAQILLKRLDVRRTHVTQSAVERFHRQLPSCLVISDFGRIEYEHRLPKGWELPAEEPTTYLWPDDQPAPAIAPFTPEEAQQHQAAWAEHLDVPVEIENSIGMKFRVIPPGEFLMGSSEEESQRLLEELTAKDLPVYENKIPREVPQHRVVLTNAFAMGSHEVTRRQFRQFVDATGHTTEAERDGLGGEGYQEGQEGRVRSPEFLWHTGIGSGMLTDEHPVVNVSFSDAVAFCEWLSEQEGVPYRLPTEAEWEYACRAGSTTRFHFGNDDAQLGDYASLGGPLVTVGQHQPNAFGLFDVYGSVWEICPDFYGSYTAEPAIDPVANLEYDARIARGGSWTNPPVLFRSAIRWGFAWKEGDGGSSLNFGFRVVRDISNGPDPQRLGADEFISAVGDLGGTIFWQGSAARQAVSIEKGDDLPPLAGRYGLSLRFSRNETFGDEHLAQLAALARRQFGAHTAVNLNLSATRISDAGLKSLSGLWIRWLALNNTGITDDAVPHLLNIHGLETLHLPTTELTERGLTQLAQIPTLTAIILNRTPVNAVTISAWEKLQLHFLKLDNTPLGRAELQAIARIPTLTHLALGNAEVTDELLPELTLLTNLIDLKLPSNDVTAKGIDALHRALPKCRISWDAGTIEPVQADGAEADEASQK